MGSEMCIRDRLALDFFQRSDRTKEMVQAIRQIVGDSVALDFILSEQQGADNKPQPKLTRVQMIRQLEEHKMVKNAIEVFDAEIVEFQNNPKSQ